MVISGRADAQDVERVQLAAAARGQRAGLHDERRVSRDVVAIGRVPDMADMQMSGEKKIGARLGEALHRDRRASDEMLRTGYPREDRTDDA